MIKKLKSKKRTGGGFETYLTPEQREHSKIVEFIRFNPKTKNTLWFHTMNEGRRTTFERFLWGVLGGRKGVSDFIFLAPRGKYSGLIFEHKPVGTLVYRKNGTCYFPEQEEFLKMATEAGFRAEFTIGTENAITLLKDYFG
jgi:hypothetical protein